MTPMPAAELGRWGWGLAGPPQNLVATRSLPPVLNASVGAISRGPLQRQ